VTAGIGIAGVDGSRPRRLLRTIGGVERLLRSGRAGPVAGGLGRSLNIEPIITISCRGDDRSGAPHAEADRRSAPLAALLAAARVARTGPRRAALSAITPVIAAHGGIEPSGVCCQIADGTNACRMRYD
jgi:fatty acid-binding protein DegV